MMSASPCKTVWIGPFTAKKPLSLAGSAARSFSDSAGQKPAGVSAFGAAGGGVITAVCGGNRELKSITIDPEAVDPDDVEMLQDMIVAAVNEAMRKAEADQSANMAKLTGGLNLGGLF